MLIVLVVTTYVRMMGDDGYGDAEQCGVGDLVHDGDDHVDHGDAADADVDNAYRHVADAGGGG
eukprot:1275867-Pyramimonas_sp.AAC.1